MSKGDNLLAPPKSSKDQSRYGDYTVPWGDNTKEYYMKRPEYIPLHVPPGEPMDPMDHDADSGHNSSYSPGKAQ